MKIPTYIYNSFGFYISTKYTNYSVGSSVLTLPVPVSSYCSAYWMKVAALALRIPIAYMYNLHK